MAARHVRALSAFLLIVALFPSTGRATEANSTLLGSCKDVAVPVSLAEGLPRDYTVRGRLCLPRGRTPTTVQLLLHGATYRGIYWDFPYQPERYSYVRALVADGYATLDIDRLGFGSSSHPLSPLVTMETGAHAIHQVIQAARNGTLGVRFDRVIVVGHSHGTVIAWREAAAYHDIDGLIATGNTHRVSPTTGLNIALHLYPASMDPQFANSGLDPGYLTSRPGFRGVFYREADADPNVITTDEATKDTVSLLDLFPTYQLELFDGDSSKIHVPVLIAVGRYDRLMCSRFASNCSSASTLLADERFFYSGTSCLEAYVLPGAGHDMNLHLNAPDFFTVAARWSDRWIGSSPSTNNDPSRCVRGIGGLAS